MPSRKICLLRITSSCERVRKITSSDAKLHVSTTLKDLENEFDLYRDLVDREIETDETGQIEAEFERIDTIYSEAKKHLVTILDSYSNVSSEREQDSQSAMEKLLNHQQDLLDRLSSSSQRIPTAALPKVSIPNFTGDIQSWPAFRDVFCSTVHENEDLSPVAKLQYLRSCLSGPAESLIKTISISAENYSIAWKTLEAAYNKPYLIVESILSRFLNCKPVSKNLRPLLNVFRETIEMLDNQGCYAQSRDPLFIYLMVQKLDSESELAWANYIKSDDAPRIELFLKFLEERCSILERVAFSNHKEKLPAKPEFSKRHSLSINKLSPSVCFCCSENHSIFKCEKFRAFSVSEREKMIATQARCYNCLSKGHSLRACSSTKGCLKCNKRHHTLLHREVANTSPAAHSSSQALNSDPAASNLQLNSNIIDSTIILPTAVIRLTSASGKQIIARALLDTGSQGTFITDSLLKRLCLRRTQSRIPISCLVNNDRLTSKGKAQLKISSMTSDYEFSCTAHVLSRFPGELPPNKIVVNELDQIRTKFKLADPNFHVPSKIDIILSASIFFEVIKSSRFLNQTDQLYLQDSQLGFLVCSKNCESKSLCLNTYQLKACDQCSDALLEKFWVLEEVPVKRPFLSSNDRECEEIYQKTTTQLTDGRFCVRLPFTSRRPSLGRSFEIALRRFHLLERRFESNADLANTYRAFMNEYELLGHMRKNDLDVQKLPVEHYIIPHHPIWQHGPSGPKLRVVFDASAKTSNGVSLNDILHIGPRLQQNITSVVNWFRQHKYVMTADIEKMYRQIVVHPDDQTFQLIIWRDSPHKPLSIYQLTTVTYGESCSPYLALRTINHLIDQEGNAHPRAVEHLNKGRYVDDIFFGSENVETLLNIRNDIIQLLAKGGFSLKKWATNNPKLLSDINHSDLLNPLIFSDKENDTTKTLGLIWHPNQDSFSFNFNFDSCPVYTKRALLSETAKFYDPLGWISPTVLMFKVLFQETWVKKLGWDEPLPDDLRKTWSELRTQISFLSKLRIPRRLLTGGLELHGFSDASKTAYAAVVYLRTISSEGTVTTQIIAAKTKLAPLKPTSIPRLELCAAFLLANLIHSLRTDFAHVERVFLWSDSSTVLAWLKSLPSKWNPFVANRVSLIDELCPKIPWYYVKSSSNPADVASRGASPHALINSDLWWNGPTFLRSPEFQLPSSPQYDTEDELRPLRVNVALNDRNFWISYTEKFSSLQTCLRTLCYVFRSRSKFQRKSNDCSNTLDADEIKSAFGFLIKQVQVFYFREEIERLRNSQPLLRSSHVLTLAPFLDATDFLRVGGRLRNANVSEFNSTPLLLPHSHFSDLIIRKAHFDTFHGGQTVVCANVRKEFWIVNLRKSANRIVRSCPRCTRYKGKTYNPEMGLLPSYRISPAKPFETTGVDFAGPISLRPYKGRGKTTVKGYIALFVCAVTKALHLELIMGLETTCLIMGIRRFIARRGQCKKFLSDNGRNFAACSIIAKDFATYVRSLPESSDLKNFLANSMISWDFIPPYSPHFGGLWESGIKSVKGHLARMFGSQTMTIEEFTTALCQIESILNSRPLAPIAFSEPLEPITPSLLLNGHPSSSFLNVPQSDDRIDSRKPRLESVRNLVNGFWKRWRQEYLDTLVRRPKWHVSSTNPAIGDIVLIKRENDPPQFWNLAKITKLFPGKDDKVRVVEVSKNGTFRTESVRNLIPLKLDAGASTGGV